MPPLQQLRERRKKSRAALARESGLNEILIAAIEEGIVPVVSDKTVRALSRALDVPAGEVDEFRRVGKHV